MMLGYRVGFPAELRFGPFGLHTRTALLSRVTLASARFFVTFRYRS